MRRASADGMTRSMRRAVAIGVSMPTSAASRPIAITMRDGREVVADRERHEVARAERLARESAMEGVGERAETLGEFARPRPSTVAPRIAAPRAR
jgi:hypothetical protein